MAVTIDNTAVVVEWREDAGDPLYLPFAKTNTPVSMVGWTLELKVYASWDDNTAVATFTPNTTDAASGVVSFTNAAITPGTYWFRLRRTDGTAKTLMKGPLIIPAEEV